MEKLGAQISLTYIAFGWFMKYRCYEH